MLVTATRYRYTGREYDDFTGLYYYRARYYDANLGRFISEDPIGFNGGDVNLFGYVRNRPLKYKDSLGLDNPADPDSIYKTFQREKMRDRSTFENIRPEEFPHLFDDFYYGKNSCHSFGNQAQSRHFPKGDPTGNPDPYDGGYRHCVATCVAVRRYGPFFGHLARRVGWNLYNEILNPHEDSVSDMANEDIGEQHGAPENPNSCETSCLKSFPGTD